MRPSRRLRDKRVRLAGVSPSCRQRLERTFLVVEEHPVLAPGLAYRQQFVATPMQRMERMGDGDNLLLTCVIGCSR